MAGSAPLLQCQVTKLGGLNPLGPRWIFIVADPKFSRNAFALPMVPPVRYRRLCPVSESTASPSWQIRRS